MVKNKTKWIKEQSDMKKTPPQYYKLTFSGKNFFTKFMQLAEERGRINLPQV